MRLLAGGVDDIDRHARHVGDHDGAVGRLALDFRRPRIGVRLGPVVALGQQLCRHRRDDVAVLGMDQRQRAELGAALERREHLVVVHHQRALVGHEMLEGGDAAIDHLGHLVEHLLAPPGDRHVERIVGSWPCAVLLSHICSASSSDWLGDGQAEIDHHRGAAGERRARAALEIVGRIGAHERHFEMGVRIDAARHDVAAGRVEHRRRR